VRGSSQVLFTNCSRR